MYAAWLAAPFAAAQSHQLPAEPDAWNPGNNADAAVGSQLWTALSESQRALVDSVAASGKIEAAQLAKTLQLSGAIAVVQEATAINAVAATLKRATLLELSTQTESVVLEINAEALKTLTRQN
jgi:hypothetical protein